ncbi:MAG: amino acid-binding protein [Nocardioidaceae bacterium]
MPYLLRVELPDIPGSLGAVATAIGTAGGDIDAIEIVEHRPDGTAVDDVLLEPAPGVMPDSIVSACNALAGVRVLWVSRYGAGGNLFLDLEAVEALTESPEHALDRLVELAPLTFRSDWAARIASVSGGVKVVYATSAAPDITDAQAAWFPLTKAQCVDAPEEWGSVVAAAQVANESDLIAFGRRGGPDILDSELARLQHLTALAVSISGNR